MKNVSFRLIVIIFCFPVLFACKKDNPVACGSWASELTNEITAWSTASAVYFNDPSEANCTAYKAAYQDYIDALKPYGDCSTLTGPSRADWQKAIEDAEAEIDTIC